MKKLLTIDDLYKFCEEANFNKFSSADTGYKVVVQMPSTFEEVEDEDLTHAGLMRLKIKVAHIGRNRNNSYISEENMKKALPSLKNRPVLGYIHQLNDGTYDFWAHNVEFEDDEDGNPTVVEYLEKQIGSFTEDEPFLEYDEENDKTYAVAYAVIPETYSKAADIIRSKKGTKNSCELFIDKFVFNSQEKCIELIDFFFGGSTMLGSDDQGTPIDEGMEGSRADIVDFAENQIDIQNNNDKKGGSILLEKLLEKYGKTLEDLTFEYENLSDEELESKFAEVFDDDDVAEEIAEDVSEDVVDAVDELFDDNEDAANVITEDEADSNDEETVIEEELVNESLNDEESREEVVELSADDNTDNTEEMDVECNESHRMFNTTFELSFDDIHSAIYSLTSIYRNENEWCYPFKVYSDYFLMEDWDSTKYFKQSYTIDENDNVALEGEREEVFAEFLDASEKSILDTMRKEYSTLVQKVEQYEHAELEAKKSEILNDPIYAEYLQTEEFINLVENREQYTLDEFRDQAEIAFARCIKAIGNFDANKITHETNRQRIAFGSEAKEKKRPYGNLFDK